MKLRRTVVSFVVVCLVAVSPSLAQPPAEKVNADVVAKIKDEGLKRSQVMDLISTMTDVHGPRLTGSPQLRSAS